MTNTTTTAQGWLFTKKWTPLFCKPIKLLDKHEHWRRVAKILKISKTAQLRLEWIIYYYFGHSAIETARHYGAPAE